MHILDGIQQTTGSPVRTLSAKSTEGSEKRAAMTSRRAGQGALVAERDESSSQMRSKHRR